MAEAFHPAQGEQPKYQCAACQEPVFVFDGKVFRTCACPTDTAVLANLQAIVTGQGKAQ